MDETQHFRLAGTTAVEKIDYDHVDGHNVIYWEDIELVFPGVKYVKCNDVTVKPLRDSNRNRYDRHRLDNDVVKRRNGKKRIIMLTKHSDHTPVK